MELIQINELIILFNNLIKSPEKIELEIDVNLPEQFRNQHIIKYYQNEKLFRITINIGR